VPVSGPSPFLGWFLGADKHLRRFHSEYPESHTIPNLDYHSTVLRLLYDFLSLKTDVKVPLKTVISKKLVFILLASRELLTKKQDTDPQVSGMDLRIRIRTKSTVPRIYMGKLRVGGGRGS
jgi:hypothetical protein